jgi:GWxTD domain-containing protein
MRSQSLAVIVLFSATLFAAEPTLPDLFRQAKDEFAHGDYTRSLADFELLDAMSLRPGMEKDRAKLASVITFYRAGNLASLGRREEARDQFINFLAMMPNASIASPPYSAKVVDAFQQARKEMEGKSGSLAVAYAQFVPPAGWILAGDEHWIESPVRLLLTPAQKAEYATFATPAERQTFVERFWKQLDPTPATDANEFRSEFERRVAFADASFSTDKMPGRNTDRAAVFALFGPPTYAGSAYLSSSDDVMANLRSAGNQDMGRAVRGSNSTGGFGTITGTQPTDNLEVDAKRGVREAWYYRRARIPKELVYPELRFDFITKEGYGTGVMQKDPQPMQAIGQAAEVARKTKALN